MEEILLQKKFEEIVVTNRNQKISAYYFEPELNEKHSAVILLTEIWGINENILDVANRIREQGYIVLVPDLLSETGIPERIDLQLFKDLKNPETKEEATKKAKELFSPIRVPEFEERTTEKLQACFEHLDSKENVEGIGVMGFSFGGHYSFVLAINQSKLKACVVFYGRNPGNLNDIEKINCPVLGFYPEHDSPVMENLPDIIKKMEEYKKDFTYIIYPMTKHSFFNDRNPKVYSKEATEDSWEKTLDFFKENLG